MFSILQHAEFARYWVPAGYRVDLTDSEDIWFDNHVRCDREAKTGAAVVGQGDLVRVAPRPGIPARSSTEA